MNSLLILPTYNERENLPELIPRILSVFKTDILVIDDHSPDGTGEIAQEISRETSSLFVKHRPEKMGLGSAYVEGFRWALARSYDCVVQMDSDFSHSPQDLPQLVSALSNCDLVIGSRYVQGGAIQNWPLYRLAVSALGNVYARYILQAGIQDLTGGFKAFRRKVIETYPLDKILSDGYAFQIETTYRAIQKGFKVLEIPIVFKDRTRGKSKISRRVVWEAMKIVWQLRGERNPKGR